MESAVSLYRDLIKYPEVSSAVIGKLDKGGNAVIHTIQTQRDLEREENVKFTKTFYVHTETGKCSVLQQSAPQEIYKEYVCFSYMSLFYNLRDSW